MYLTLLSMMVLASGQGSRSKGRHLVFDQNFARVRAIDPAKWHFDDGRSYNNEIEKYTSATGGNAWIEKSNLVIEARKANGVVTSARLQSVAAWVHPYVEVVARVPSGKGTWPAIWMLNDRLRHPGSKPRVGWPACGEIDIMENVGYDPKIFHFSLHSAQFNWMKKEQRTVATDVAKPAGFHKFAMDCRADSIVFLVDDKPVYTVENKEKTFAAWPFDDPFYLILNLAIGGNWGGRMGVDDSIFPRRYYIRSVKVYA